MKLILQIYLMHADSKVHFPSVCNCSKFGVNVDYQINRSTLISAYSFTCNGLCFIIYCVSAASIIRSKVIFFMIAGFKNEIHISRP